MHQLKTRAEGYLRKAADFAQKAETAGDTGTQTTYRNLAESYRQLSRKVMSLSAASDDEIEAFARRMVQK